MPRRRSSAQRSGSIPVRARTSVDLPWSTWPAVAITCTRSDPASHGARPRRAASSSTPRGRSAGRAGSRPRSIRPTTGGSPARSGAASAGRQRDGPAGQRHARAHRHRRPRRRRAPPRAPTAAAASRSQRAAELGRVGVQVRAVGRRARAAQGRLQRGQGELVDAERPGQRMPAQPLDQLGPPEQQPGLRAAEQLVAAAGDDVGAGAAARWRRPVRRAAAGRAPAARCRCRRPPARPGRPARATPTRRVKPVIRKLLGWILRMQPVSGPIGRGVVGHRGPVGGADLAEPGAGGRRSGRAAGSRRRSRPVSPRLTITSRPAASAVTASSSAAAPLFTTSASSARRAPPPAAPRARRARAAPAAGRRGRTRRPRSRPPRSSRRPRRRRAAPGPRLVCSTTPVALITGRRLVARVGQAARRTASDRDVGASRPARDLRPAPLARPP